MNFLRDSATARIDEVMMAEAVKEAKAAGRADEVPIGAVIVHKNEIVARAHNQVETLNDPTAHAEMIAITQAANTLGSKWLTGCSLYVTIEPCSMCAGALVLARIKKICFGASDPKTGACGTVLNITQHKKLNHSIEVHRGVMQEECGFLVTEFFQQKRKQEPEKSNPQRKLF